MEEEAAQRTGQPEKVSKQASFFQIFISPERTKESNQGFDILGNHSHQVVTPNLSFTAAAANRKGRFFEGRRPCSAIPLKHKAIQHSAYLSHNGFARLFTRKAVMTL